MTKREYLESIGYDSYDIQGYHKIIKFTDSKFYIHAYIFHNFFTHNSEYKFYLEPTYIRTQKDIDNLQIAFNNVKRDYEEMQKYENE